MKTLLTAVMALMFSVHAYAIPQEIRQRDLKLKTQQMVEKESFVNPSAASSNGVLSAHAGNTSEAAVTVTSFDGQPDMARNLVVTPGGTTADVGVCKVEVTGTDMKGAPLLELFSFSAGQSDAVVGSLAFASVTKVKFPGSCETGGFAATWSVGVGEKLGMDRCMDLASHLFYAGVSIGGVGESTGKTVAVGSSVASTTIDFNAPMNGSNDFEAFFFQNFNCY